MQSLNIIFFKILLCSGWFDTIIVQLQNIIHFLTHNRIRPAMQCAVKDIPFFLPQLRQSQLSITLIKVLTTTDIWQEQTWCKMLTRV